MNLEVMVMGDIIFNAASGLMWFLIFMYLHRRLIQFWARRRGETFEPKDYPTNRIVGFAIFMYVLRAIGTWLVINTVSISFGEFLMINICWFVALLTGWVLIYQRAKREHKLA